MKAYEEVEVKPIIENTKNAFKIIVENQNQHEIICRMGHRLICRTTGLGWRAEMGLN